MLSLYDVIKFSEEFDFSQYYDHEQKFLKPALQNIGASFISFHDGERDSFGPLSRIVRYFKDGQDFEAFYG